MTNYKRSASIAAALLTFGVMGAGCVADRPARNGVFNENQYVRKDFLIQGVDANGTADVSGDPGWLMRATVTDVSTPNLLGGEAFDIWGGAMSDVQLVRWRVTEDKLQLLSMVQLSNPVNPAPDGSKAPGSEGAVNGGTNSTGITQAVVNAWPATNVDLKYRVNLDGETTNFYEENQELDWQVRQWVKLQFDKNDFSDLAPMGLQAVSMLNMCGSPADASATLVTDSFMIEGDGDNDISNDYMEFTVQVSIPLNFTNQTCLTAYGPTLLQQATFPNINRTTVTVNLKYSFMRATPMSQVTYKPFALAEKDPIHRKYGPLMWTVFNFDEATSLMAANQYVERFDPTQPITWYFDPNFPEYYKYIFRNPKNPNNLTTIQGQTNAVLKAAGAKAQVNFLEANSGGVQRSYGDIRYNFLRWVSDQAMQDTFAGVTMPGVDPRTGQMINEGIEFNDFAVRDYYVQRIDAFLQSVGASGNGTSYMGTPNSWKTGPCNPTQTPTRPIVDDALVDLHNASDTLFAKMATYLTNATSGSTPQGPSDWIYPQDPDFLNAYYTIAPYELFADPDANLFVVREGGEGVFGPAGVVDSLNGEANFQQLSAQINNGQTPWAQSGGAQGVANAANFANQMRDATESHRDMLYMNTMITGSHKMDAPGAFSLETVMEQDSQQCLPSASDPTSGTWESQDQWIQHIIDTYWQQVFWHEFGHSMGLEHNFMASIDEPNFTRQRNASGTALSDTNGNPLYNQYSSSVMEYNASPARLAWTQGWGHYDAGAIAWLYANNGPQSNAGQTKALNNLPVFPRSGQIYDTASPNGYPYNDPLGVCGKVLGTNTPDPDCTQGQERQYMWCDEVHTRYSPLCRAGDLGVTPSQIVANAINDYEWTYQWRNFRDYRKVWNASEYANEVYSYVVDLRRFLPQWYFDWSPGDISTTLFKLGVKPPVSEGGVSQQDYYAQLTQKFLSEMSWTNRMVAAFDEAVLQQSAGERPYATVYDNYYGDVTQQGIILDKYFAMQDFVGIWPVDNYDPSQSAGTYLSSWADFDFDTSYQSVAETAITSMIGEQYAAYPYFIPTAVALFAQDSHSPSFLSNAEGLSGAAVQYTRIESKDWIGGQVFYRLEDLINYFKAIAVANSGPTNIPAGCDPNVAYPATDSGGTLGCVPVCTSIENCLYDVTDPAIVQQSQTNGQFVAPDGLNYVYGYIPSRNEYIVARQDRNVVMWLLLTTLNTDIYSTKDDGTEGAYSDQYQIEYTIDSYEAYEQGSETADQQESDNTGAD